MSFFVVELLPLFRGAKELVVLYPMFEEYDLNWLIGKEWVLLGLLSGLLSVIFWHVLFFSVISGRNWFMGIIERRVLIKSYDYFWYIGSFISVLLSLNVLNVGNLVSVEDNLQSEIRKFDEVLSNTSKAMSSLCSKEEIVNSNNSKDNISTVVCNSSDFSLSQLEVCNDFDSEINDLVNFNEDNRKKIAKSLSTTIYVHCETLSKLEISKVRLNDIRQKIRSESASIFNKLFWTFFLPVIIGFRVVKTTIEFADERRKIIADSEVRQKIDVDEYSLKYIYPSVYSSK
ncbi:hypothetical protein ITG09_06805 [Vibrio cyclitrophicus]|nr:hypothetical protein [Vibrio cyclitrophicus]UPR53327.1 hypothetical protein ITG09_06805 [Vibrio cyclitrophicus]